MNNDWKKRFAALMISQMVSMLGSSVVSLAIMWYVTLQTNSGLAVAGVTATTFLPQMLVMLPGGALADRYAPKRIIMLSDSFIAVSTLILAVLFFMKKDTLGLLFFFNTLRSLGTGIQMPAIRSILPQAVPEEYLMKANSINTGIWSVISLISPGIGGFMLQAFAMQQVLLLDVITAVIGVFLLGLIRFDKRSITEEENPWSSLKNGIIYIGREKALKLCIIFYALFQFLVVPASQLTPLLAARNLGQDVSTLSLAETAFSLGALIVCAVMTLKEIPVPHFKLIGGSAILFGATMIGILKADSVMKFLMMMLLMGMGSPLYYTPLTTYIQEHTKEEYMGRVFSAVDLFSTMALPLGMLLFGPLANVGIWIPFLLPGICLILLGAGAIISKNR